MTPKQEGMKWTIIAILSFHGSNIEPGTSEIDDTIPGSDHTFYTFGGMDLELREHIQQHLASTGFNAVDDSSEIPWKRSDQHLQYLRSRDGNSIGDQQGIADSTV